MRSRAALAGRGCHLATVNDYLAQRDADWMGPIYKALGLSVGVIQTQMSQPQRRKAYQNLVAFETARDLLARREDLVKGPFIGDDAWVRRRLAACGLSPPDGPR